jgi:hypothetical protein
MAYCSACGSKLESAERFCKNCGKGQRAVLSMLEGFDVRDLLHLRALLSPKFARVAYYLLVGFFVLAGFIVLIRGLDMPWGGEPVVMLGLIVMTIIPLLIRVSFEILLVSYMIHDKLGDIQGKVMPTDQRKP